MTGRCENIEAAGMQTLTFLKPFDAEDLADQVRQMLVG